MSGSSFQDPSSDRRKAARNSKIAINKGNVYWRMEHDYFKKLNDSPNFKEPSEIINLS